MNLIDIDKASGSDGVFNLYAIGDLHLERKEFDEARFKAWRDLIAKDPQAVVVFVGDATEGRTPGMKHFDPECIRPEFLNNLDSFVKQSLDVGTRLLKPITEAGVPLVVVEGNHDRYQSFCGYSAMLADRCNASYLGGEGFIRIKSGKVPSRIYSTVVFATHGTGGGKKPGSKVNEMQDTLSWVEADVVVKGHVHDGDIRIVHRLGVNRKGPINLVKIPQVLYRAPSFLQRAIPGVVGYQGRQGYPTSDEGLQWITFNPHKRSVKRHEADF